MYSYFKSHPDDIFMLILYNNSQTMEEASNYIITRNGSSDYYSNISDHRKCIESGEVTNTCRRMDV